MVPGPRPLRLPLYDRERRRERERNSLARGSPVSVRLIYAVLFHTGVRAAGPVKMRRGMSGRAKCPLSVSTVRLNREEDRGQQRMRCRSNDTALTSGESGYIG